MGLRQRRARPRRRGPARAYSARLSAMRLAAHGHHVAVEQPVLEQVAAITAGTPPTRVQVAHVEPAVGLHVGQVRHARRDVVEVVERRGRRGPRGRWPAGAGPRSSTRRAPSPPRWRSRRPACVMTWRALIPASSRSSTARPTPRGVVVAARVDRRHRGAAQQRHAQGLADAGHGVGREHPGAAALARAGVRTRWRRARRRSSRPRRWRPPPRRPLTMSRARRRGAPA